MSQIIADNNLGSYSYDTIREELIRSINDVDYSLNNLSNHSLNQDNKKNADIFILSKRHIYKSDSIVRRSESLKMTEQSKFDKIYISKNLKDNIDQSIIKSLHDFNLDDSQNKLVVDRN